MTPLLVAEAPVEAPHEHIRVVPRPDGRGGVVLRITSAEVTDGRRRWPGASDAAVVDVDGDGVRELVTCGAAGLALWPWDREDGVVLQLSARPCRQLAVEAEALWAVGAEVRRWTLPGPIDRGSPASGEVALLAVSGERAWVASGATVAELGGPTHLATAEVTALAAGPWWVADGRLAGPQGVARTFPEVGALLLADLEQDGVPERIVAHPAAKLVGVIGADGVERSVPCPLAPLTLAAGDLDGDGVPEVVAGDGRSFSVLRRPAPTPAVVPAAPEPAAAPIARPAPAGSSGPTAHRGPDPNPPRSRRPASIEVPYQRLVGLEVASFAGSSRTLASGRAPSSRLFTGGLGVALGSSLAPGRGSGGSPAATAAFEFGLEPMRSWAGFDTAPLLLHAGNVVLWHALFASGGVTLGGPHLRSGPYATIGAIGAGFGWRAVLVPTERPSGAMHGLEARIAGVWGLSVTGEQAREPFGEVLLLYASTVQLGAREGAWNPAAVTTVPSPPGEGALVCRRLSLALGAAGSLSSTRLAWEFIGTGQTVDASLSPYASIACETGEERRGWVASADTAPVLVYRVPWIAGRSDQRARHLGSVTFGPTFGGDRGRVGPIVTAGVWTLGAGLRAAVTPIASRRGSRHGLELRATALFPSSPSGSASLAWVGWVDPRRRFE